MDPFKISTKGRSHITVRTCFSPVANKGVAGSRVRSGHLLLRGIPQYVTIGFKVLPFTIDAIQIFQCAQPWKITYVACLETKSCRGTKPSCATWRDLVYTLSRHQVQQANNSPLPVLNHSHLWRQMYARLHWYVGKPGGIHGLLYSLDLHGTIIRHAGMITPVAVLGAGKPLPSTSFITVGKNHPFSVD